MTEVSQHGLVSTDDGGDLDLLQKVFQGVVFADHHFRQVAHTG